MKYAVIKDEYAYNSKTKEFEGVPGKLNTVVASDLSFKDAIDIIENNIKADKSLATIKTSCTNEEERELCDSLYSRLDAVKKDYTNERVVHWYIKPCLDYKLLS